MEIDIDSKSRLVRPLPSKRLNLQLLLCWDGFWPQSLSSFGSQSNSFYHAFAAANPFRIYVCLYTDEEKNWFKYTGGAVQGFSITMGLEQGGFDLFAPYFLFGLLFLWQLPHFVAINWMY